LCRANYALINYNKVRLARADHALRVRKAVHVNRDPAAVHKDEVRIPDQPEMVRPVPLDEELFLMPPKTEHFTMTRSELFLDKSGFSLLLKTSIAATIATFAFYRGNPIYSLLPRHLPSVSRVPRVPFLLSRVPDSFHHEADPFQFRAKQFRLRFRELDQRRPHPGPFRTVRVDRNRLFYRRDHRRKFPAAENFAHDV